MPGWVDGVAWLIGLPGGAILLGLAGRGLAVADASASRPGLGARPPDAATLVAYDLGLAIAVVGAVLGAAILVVIVVASRRSVIDRDALQRVFAPVMWFSLGSTALLVPITGVALTAIGLGLLTTIGAGSLAASVGLMAVGAISAEVGLIQLIRRFRRPDRVDLLSIRLDPDRDPALFSLVERIARQVGTEPPDHIRLCLQPMTFVTEAPVMQSGAPVPGRSLFVSCAHLAILDRHEMTAVLGHEMAHFAGSDLAFSTRFYPRYRGLVSALASGRGRRSLATRPGLVVIRWFLGRFAAAERRLDRDREQAADAAGAGVASSTAMARAVLRVAGYGELWRATIAETLSRIRGGPTPPDVIAVYLGLVDRENRDYVIRRLSTPKAGALASHPSARERVEALGQPWSPAHLAEVLRRPIDDVAAGLVATYESDVRLLSKTVTDELHASYFRTVW